MTGHDQVARGFSRAGRLGKRAMPLAACIAMLIAIGTRFVWAQGSDVEQVLHQIKSADRDLLAVSEEDGRFLRVMVTARGATRALEIGGASGYSAIWIGL